MSYSEEIVNRLRGHQFTPGEAELVREQLRICTRLPRTVYVVSTVEDHEQGLARGVYSTLEKAVVSLATEQWDIVLTGGDGTWEVYRKATPADRLNRYVEKIENGLVYCGLAIDEYEVDK